MESSPDCSGLYKKPMSLKIRKHAHNGSDATIHVTRSLLHSTAGSSHVSRDISHILPYVHMCYNKPSRLLFGVNIISLSPNLNIWYLDYCVLGKSISSMVSSIFEVQWLNNEIGLELNTDKCECLIVSDNDIAQQEDVVRKLHENLAANESGFISK
ncbi:hypothetical protein GJ496_005652 [Pomphorhynchus laevis]|nr:hypothetical protein GJ496_005652 [Pomphorhynchus laevis]